MPLDAICLRAVLHEIEPQLLGARIDKVQQPTRDQIVLLVRDKTRVLLSANPNQPRIQLTGILRDNPAQPPMFCMLLRKHLVGARILKIEQPDLERVVILTLLSSSEIGEVGERKLVLECMGRRSNLILLDAEGRILDCLRRVDLESSSPRQLLPGLFYHLPSPIDKLSLLTQTEDALALAARGSETEAVDKWLLDHYTGISPLIAREIAHSVGGATDVRFSDLSAIQRAKLSDELYELSVSLKQNNFTPFFLCCDGKPVDFTYRPIAQYGGGTVVEPRESFSSLLDEFYDLREKREISARRSRELTHAVSTARDRMARKVEYLKKDLAAARSRDTFRLHGDLITSNLYRMHKGMTHFAAENFFEEDSPLIDIPLDPLLTPQQNAAKYYKQYNKAKNAEFHLNGQIEKAENERAYLESVLQELSQAEAEREFAEIRRELQEVGYLKRNKDAKKEKSRPFAPLEFRSRAGLRILVGRNNTQNDLITKSADKRDLWFHTQKIHGSHVILCCEGAQPDEGSIGEAAMLAAWYSQARESSNVPVDYTPVKFVKKPAGARPGMVVYDTCRTVYVTPEAPKPEKA